MEPEILWSTADQTDPLPDLKRFVRSLDYSEISIDVEGSNGRYVYLRQDGYDISTSRQAGAFRCPHCGGERFDLMLGDFQGKPVLGLWCQQCETYGAVFPEGI